MSGVNLILILRRLASHPFSLLMGTREGEYRRAAELNMLMWQRAARYTIVVACRPLQAASYPQRHKSDAVHESDVGLHASDRYTIVGSSDR